MKKFREGKNQKVFQNRYVCIRKPKPFKKLEKKKDNMNYNLISLKSKLEVSNLLKIPLYKSIKKNPALLIKAYKEFLKRKDHDRKMQVINSEQEKFHNVTPL